MCVYLPLKLKIFISNLKANKCYINLSSEQILIIILFLFLWETEHSYFMLQSNSRNHYKSQTFVQILHVKFEYFNKSSFFCLCRTSTSIYSGQRIRVIVIPFCWMLSVVSLKSWHTQYWTTRRTGKKPNSHYLCNFSLHECLDNNHSFSVDKTSSISVDADVDYIRIRNIFPLS